ncbi:MAG: hypothetical protein KGI45_02740 [Patescibacteria group bacterium]|nr:hypothetical protein [Patescibacteria group bacterium]MDE1941300.1 hypothetical protein [Patescibacteria group bacterium]MDE1966963.1 hypothetical protein [Patescibacteria group bacterium]
MNKMTATSKIILALAALLVILLSFQAGVTVGYRRGSFATNADTGMVREFQNPRSFFASFFHDGDDSNPNGAVGRIISVSLPTFMLKGPTSEQIVNISPTTTIRIFRDLASSSALQAGQEAIVIGNPGENGQINAVFVRIMPRPFQAAPPSGSSTASYPSASTSRSSI